MNNNDARNVAISLLENEIEKLSQAYQKGYEKGVEDTKAAMAEKMSKNDEVDDVEWMDLSLPSGTLWSKPLKYKDGKYVELTFDQAKKYVLPTADEVDELLNHTCQYGLVDYGVVQIRSKDGFSIDIENSPFTSYWTSEEKSYSNAFSFNAFLRTAVSFKGNKNFVMLVKRKK